MLLQKVVSKLKPKIVEQLEHMERNFHKTSPYKFGSNSTKRAACKTCLQQSDGMQKSSICHISLRYCDINSLQVNGAFWYMIQAETNINEKQQPSSFPVFQDHH